MHASFFHARRAVLLLVVGCLSLASCSRPPDDVVPEPTNEQYLIRGRELVRGLAACGSCHGEIANPSSPLRGGRVFSDGTNLVTAPNLTSHQDGIGKLTTQQLVSVIRTGVIHEDREIVKNFHAGFEWLSDEDLLSVVAYLRTLPPVPGSWPRREGSSWSGMSLGLFDEDRVVRGYVPAISPRFQREYGEYLVNHVARCDGCHSTPATILSSEVYLGGGQEVVRGDQVKVAPNITASSVLGIGSWSEEGIVQYLTSGVAPDGSRSDPAFCPTSFYALASPEDLRAIAAFLKSIQ